MNSAGTAPYPTDNAGFHGLFGLLPTGIILAPLRGVTLQDATMLCPKCRRDRPAPLAGSTWVVAWYVCCACGHFWSARIRNGQPVVDTEDFDTAPSRDAPDSDGVTHGPDV